MLNIVNYVVRILIIVVGAIFTTGWIVPKDGDITRYRIMGIVFMLFGIYRIVMYRMKSRQYDFSSEEEENNNQ